MKNNCRIYTYIFILLLTSGSFSCTQTEITSSEETKGEIQTNMRKITLTAKANEQQRGRVFWTEDGDIPQEVNLWFNWENDETGRMKSTVWGEKGLKSFEEGPMASTDIKTADNRSSSHLTINSLLTETYQYETNDKIHAYYPIDGKYANIETTQEGTIFSFSIPNEITQTEANSTRHLSPYIYMKGVGAVHMEEGTPTSEIKFDILPSVIQFCITNTERSPFSMQEIRLGGPLAMKGSVRLVHGQKEEMVCIREQNEIAIRSNLTIEPYKSYNYYMLVLPTEFGANEQLTFNMKGKYNDGWAGSYVDIPIGCHEWIADGKLISNSIYLLDIAIAKDKINMQIGDFKIEAPKEGANTDMELGPKN